MSDTNGLSEEQIRAIDKAWWSGGLYATVAAMLAEARAEEHRRLCCDEPVTCTLPMPSAVREGGTERPGASGDSGGPSEADRPSDGRTGPRTHAHYLGCPIWRDMDAECTCR